MHRAKIGFALLIVTTLAGVSLFISCKPPEIPCSWCPDPILIDGQRDEWRNIPFSYFEKENIVLAMCNDSNNLYIMYSFNDPRWARIITISGLTLWLDAGGKKNKDFGIRFYGGPIPDSLVLSGDRFFEMMPSEQMDKRRNRGSELTIIDKKQNQEYTVPINGSSGPSVGFGTFNDIFTYEFAIPLENKDSAQTGIKAGPRDKIALGAEWGGFDRKDMRNKMGRPPGDGIMIGGRGGGMGGGGAGGMGHGPMRALEKQEVWVTTILNDKGGQSGDK